ncbi:hypothetical protein L6452_07655 [Arctium lappa]|uniref:Uncharacterized protein n=1 Tax=Arctium lappa TaxID=4217 RepID=A0ACB9EKY1_ARCLA|nr:hypothetical protein L6452_07655 [Arctium lappa]
MKIHSNIKQKTDEIFAQLWSLQFAHTFCIFNPPSSTHSGYVIRFHLSPCPNTHKSLNSDRDSFYLALYSGCLIGSLTRILGF